MNISITFRHLDHTPSLDQMIREKSEKFTKWLGQNATIDWTCWAEGIQHWAEVKVHAGNKDYFAKGQSDDLYKSLDVTIQKIHNQLPKK